MWEMNLWARLWEIIPTRLIDRERSLTQEGIIQDLRLWDKQPLSPNFMYVTEDTI